MGCGCYGRWGMGSGYEDVVQGCQQGSSSRSLELREIRIRLMRVAEAGVLYDLSGRGDTGDPAVLGYRLPRQGGCLPPSHTPFLVSLEDAD